MNVVHQCLHKALLLLQEVLGCDKFVDNHPFMVCGNATLDPSRKLFGVRMILRDWRATLSGVFKACVGLKG